MVLLLNNSDSAMEVDDVSPATSNIYGFASHIISNNIIHELLFSYMTPLEFFRLARTCQVAYGVVRSYIKRTFNVNRLLNRFFQDPLAFRSLQARTGMIIAGSLALQYFDRTHYPSSDLDLYLMPKAMVEVTAWLAEAGYEFEPYPEQPPNLQDAMNALMDEPGTDFLTGAVLEHPLYPTRSIHGVYTFTKHPTNSSGSNQPLKVQCIVSKASPMQVVFSFHSSTQLVFMLSIITLIQRHCYVACVMNVISYEKAYSLYPRASIVNHRSLVTCQVPSNGQPVALKKYADRGFIIETTVGHDDPDFPLGRRYLGDRDCWTVDLDMNGVEAHWAVNDFSTRLTHDPVCATSWALRIRSDLEGDPADVVTHNKFYSDFLFYTYTAVSWEPLYYAYRMIEEETGVDMKNLSKVPISSRRL